MWSTAARCRAGRSSAATGRCARSGARSTTPRRGAPQLALIAGEPGVGKTRLVGELEARGREPASSSCTASASSSAARSSPTRRSSRRCADLPLDDGLRASSTDARGARAALLPRRRLADASRALGPRRPGPAVRAAARPARPGGGAPAAAARARGPPLGRPLDAATARVPRPQPARRARSCVVAHLPHRRARARAPDCAGSSASWRGGRSSLRLELEPLGRDDVARQLEAIAGAPGAGRARRRAARPRRRQPVLRRGAVRRPRDARHVPATVADAVALRVERSPSGARAARGASPPPAGSAVHALLERCAPAGPGRAARGARRRAARARPRRDGVAFRHGLIGEVVYDAPAAGRARRAAPRDRRRAARRTRPPRSSPHQCQRAGAARRGARRLARGRARRPRASYAYAEASVHFERALELWDARPRAATASTCSRAPPRRPATAATRAARARARAGEALALDHAADPARRAALRAPRRVPLWDDAAALECYDAARSRCSATPTAIRARLLAAEGHALMGLRRWAESRARCEAALASPPRRRRRAGGAARTTLGDRARASSATPEAGEAHLREALASRREGEDDRARLRAPRRAAAPARRPRGRAGGDGRRASARRRGSGMRGSFGPSCTSTRSTTCCGSAAGTRPRRGCTRPSGWTSA